MNRQVIFLTGLIFIAALLTGCPAKDDKTPAAPPPQRAALVTVTEAVLADVPHIATAVGTVEPSATVTVVSRVSGELMEVHVQEGEQVEQGQLLFVIDNAQMTINLHQAEAQLEADRARLAKAEDDLNRSQQLTRGGFSSAAQNDEARVAAATLRASVKASEATLEQAQLNLSYCRIHAPMSGRAGAIRTDKGNMIPALTQPLLTIDAHAPVTVNFNVPEKYLNVVRGIGQSTAMQVTAQSSEGGDSIGELIFVGNVDVNTGTVALKATFPNSGGSMWPGEFVRLKLQLAVMKDSVTVPSRAVVIGPEGTFVYVVTAEKKAEYRLVQAGIETDGITVITEGLQAGEMVVMEGHVRLSDGVTVRLPDDAPASGNG